MVSIYVLFLSNQKYYVGKTNYPKNRINDHFQSLGSEWTRLHKPIRVVEILENQNDWDENTITLQYMKKYGIENVRGGSFSMIHLPKETVNVIQSMIYGSTDACFRCGQHGHFVKDCPKELSGSDDIVFIGLEPENKQKQSIWSRMKSKMKTIFEFIDDDSDDDNNNNSFCHRCKRYGHERDQCFAKRQRNGNII